MAEYDSYAREFSEQRASASLNRLIEEPVVHELVGDVRGVRALDAGCGDGSYARWLAERGARVVALDASGELISIAREKNSHELIEYRVHDLSEPLPFEDASFGFVLSTLVTEYIEDLGILFSECSRVLAGGGVLILSCDHPLLSGIVKNEHGERVLSDYFARKPRAYSWFGRSIEVYSHTLEDLVRSLIDAGFSIDDVCEPRPVHEAREQNPSLFERADRIPTILVIRASKR
ncbi:MAG: class I SAM-dependent methyltransferase [Candidatus Woesearchaeota archaeon]